MPPIRFTKQQRKDLLGLGLPDEVITAIEVEALPWSRRIVLHQEPRRADVLAELRAVQSALIRARDAIERFLQPEPKGPPPYSVPLPSVPHLDAARKRLAGGGYRHIMDGIPLNRTSMALVECIEVMDRAVASVEPGPVRRRTANTMAIENIHRAMQKASFFSTGQFHLPGLEPSASPESKFRDVIGICYQAIGAPFPDPERALKAYMREWRALMKAA
jgi:hypothetical protein